MDRITADSLPDMATVEEVASFLGVSRNHAYKGVDVGDIPSVRIGRIIRIPKKALLAKMGV